MLLEIKNVHKSYINENSRIDVLKGVSFGLERDTLRVLLGRSGRGKSTLLRLCAGYEKADSGEILFEGRAITGANHDRFMVFQDYDQLFPWRRVLDNVAFALRAVYPLSKAEARERAEFWLRETEMQDFGKLWPAELSGGMHQRATLARAFALSPKLLLLDEPFSALDARLRITIQDLLINLCQKHGVTALFVTHDIDEALRLDPRPAVLTVGGREIIEIADKTNTRQAILNLLAKE